jgi:hypothetical protein
MIEETGNTGCGNCKGHGASRANFGGHWVVNDEFSAYASVATRQRPDCEFFHPLT